MNELAEQKLEKKLNPLNIRCSGYQQTLIFMRENYPNAALMTYDNINHQYAYQISLAKIIPGIIVKEEIIWAEEADFCQTDNHMGWLKSTAQIAGYEIEIEFMPLVSGQKNLEWEGMSLFKVNCSHDVEVIVRFGGQFGNKGEPLMHYYPVKGMLGHQLNLTGCSASKQDDLFILENDKSPLFVTVRSNGGTKLREQKYGETIFANGQGWLLFAFSENKKRAIELAKKDSEKKEEEIKDHYNHLLDKWSLNTPDKNLNKSFEYALLNMEMSWFKPYGWVESIHHWPTFWHMEHTAAAEWAGQEDRSLECLETHIENQFSSGAIPHMCPTGETRRDWGGTNHFFFRQVAHYYKMTDDIKFLKQVESVMEKTIKQTIAEYDPEKSGLFKWATQIGNQEDFESTPGGGTAATCEAINMFNTMAMVAKALGKKQKGKKYKRLAQKSLNKLKSVLWQKDLGRFAWYRDASGNIRPEGAYHTFTSPVIYGLLDYIDSYTSLIHLRDRLSGPEGEIYLSNHFADHDEQGHATWGMQAGSNMQPFATMAYAVCNFNNQAVKPLEFVANRVCSEYQRGSWPETANEKRFAYFSPSAAVFIQGVIEGLMGLSINKANKEITVKPCIPEKWFEQELELETPLAKMKYWQTDGEIKLKLQTKTALKRKLKISLPLFKDLKVEVNGENTSFSTKRQGEHLELILNVEEQKKTIFDLNYQPIEYRVEFPKAAIVGQEIEIKPVSDYNIRILGIEDREGLIRSFKIKSDNIIKAFLADDLLKPYEKYGWSGLMNYSKRTLFIKLKVGDQVILHPCTITILPDLVFLKGKFDFESNLTDEFKSIILKTLNNQMMYNGEIILEFGNNLYSQKVELVEGISSIEFSNIVENNLCLSPGYNKGTIYFPEGQKYNVEIDAGNTNCNQVEQIVLPEKLTINKEKWQQLRSNYSHGHYLGGNAANILKKDLNIKTDTLLPGLSIQFSNEFIPISNVQQPVVEIDLAKNAKKIFLVTLNFADNHDMYSDIVKLDVYTENNQAFKDIVFNKTLSYPGDLDSAYAPAYAKFATFQGNRKEVSIPEVVKGDYLQSSPPDFPQSEYWTTSRTAEIGDVVVNLIEFDLGDFFQLDKLVVSGLQADTALGIMAICLHVHNN